MVHVLDGPPSSWAVVYPSAQLGNRFHAIAGAAYTWLGRAAEIGRRVGAGRRAARHAPGLRVGGLRNCARGTARARGLARRLRDPPGSHRARAGSVPSDLSERLGLKRSESCAAGDTTPPCVFHVGLWHGAARHHKGVRRVPPLPARASADAQKQACRAMLGRLRARSGCSGSSTARCRRPALACTCAAPTCPAGRRAWRRTATSATASRAPSTARRRSCSRPSSAMPPTERPPCVYVAARCPSLLARFRDALRGDGAAAAAAHPRSVGRGRQRHRRHAAGGRRAPRGRRLWALASVRTLLRYPYTSYSQVALSLHRRPAALDVMNATPPACAARLHTASRRDFTPARIVGTGGCRADPASATGARLACSEAVDEVCADVSERCRSMTTLRLRTVRLAPSQLLRVVLR